MTVYSIDGFALLGTFTSLVLIRLAPLALPLFALLLPFESAVVLALPFDLPSACHPVPGTIIAKYFYTWHVVPRTSILFYTLF